MSSSSDSIRAETSGWGTAAGFSERGFAVVEGVAAEVELADLRAEADRLLAESGRGAGARGGLGRSRAFADLATWPPLRGLAEECLGSSCRPVMLTVFDKSEQANWKVPWHQDLTIAVRERVDAEGFGPWSVKDGVTHVQPPTELRSRMVALRLHLDATPVTNGALRVIPGSHRQGRLDDPRIQELVSRISPVTCPVGAGGAMLMSPLLLHASSASVEPRRRRVLHIEYAAVALPVGMAWADAPAADG